MSNDHGSLSHGSSLPQPSGDATTTADKSSGTLAEAIDRHLKPAPSQQPAAAPYLARERRLVWVRPEAKQLPWLRERFHRRQDPPPVMGGWVHAWTADAAGRPVRTFTATATSLEDYADQWGTSTWCGLVTCPREAVAPQTIRCGAASRPAHQVLGHMLAAGMELADVYPACFANGNQYLGFTSLNGRRDHDL